MFKNGINLARSGFVATIGTLSAGIASAALDAGVTTALTDAAIDVAAVAGLAFLVYLAPKAFKYMRGGL